MSRSKLAAFIILITLAFGVGLLANTQTAAGVAQFSDIVQNYRTEILRELLYVYEERGPNNGLYFDELSCYVAGDSNFMVAVNQLLAEQLIRAVAAGRAPELSGGGTRLVGLINPDQLIPIREIVGESGKRKKISILFLAADPADASRLRLGEEFREIKEKLQLAIYRDRFKLELPQLSVRPADISQALLDTQPQIVHFSGHGTSEGALCFEDYSGQVHLVQPDALSALFEQFSGHVNCVLLNACYSEIQALAIAKHINYVIGMNQAIGDKAAIAFAIGFYQALGGGRSIEDAYQLGCVQIRLMNIPEHLTPVLIKKGKAK